MYMGSDASHIHLHVEIVKMYMGSDTSHIHPTHFTYTSYTLHIHILHTSHTHRNLQVCRAHVPTERWGAGVEYHFQEFHEPYAPVMVLNDGA